MLILHMENLSELIGSPYHLPSLKNITHKEVFAQFWDCSRTHLFHSSWKQKFDQQNGVVHTALVLITGETSIFYYFYFFHTYPPLDVLYTDTLPYNIYWQKYIIYITKIVN